MTAYTPPPVSALIDITINDVRTIGIRDKYQAPGCVIDLGAYAHVYLTPEGEAQLLTMLLDRVPKVALHRPPEAVEAATKGDVRPLRAVPTLVRGGDDHPRPAA